MRDRYRVGQTLVSSVSSFMRMAWQTTKANRFKIKLQQPPSKQPTICSGRNAFVDPLQLITTPARVWPKNRKSRVRRPSSSRFPPTSAYHQRFSFCEEDFIVTGWIGEFINMLTNLAYSMLFEGFVQLSNMTNAWKSTTHTKASKHVDAHPRRPSPPTVYTMAWLWWVFALPSSTLLSNTMLRLVRISVAS